MTFQQAIKQMSNGNVSDEAIRAIHSEVEPLCKSVTGGSDNGMTLWDWLNATGGYTGKETSASIAAEWDSYQIEP